MRKGRKNNELTGAFHYNVTLNMDLNNSVCIKEFALGQIHGIVYNCVIPKAVVKSSKILKKDRKNI